MTELKQKCVEQLEDVLKSVEKAMKDIQAGNYDEAAKILDELKSSYRDAQEDKKAS